jgi:SmpA / OmlA family
MNSKASSFLPLIIACAALASCAGTPFKWEDTEKVHVGMSEDEVVAILGKPHSRSASGRLVICTWSFATAFGGARAVSYSFRDGKLAGTTTLGK